MGKKAHNPKGRRKVLGYEPFSIASMDKTKNQKDLESKINIIIPTLTYIQITRRRALASCFSTICLTVCDIYGSRGGKRKEKPQQRYIVP